MPYIEGFVAAVPTANRDTYIEQAKQGAEYFKSLGATRVTECWGDDVPRGEVTDFFRATQAKDDETVIFSWIEYPDKATRDAANKKMTADPEMMNMEMPFDGQRMFWGGFELVRTTRLWPRWTSTRRAASSRTTCGSRSSSAASRRTRCARAAR